MNKWITFDLDGTIMQNPFVSHVFPEIQRIIHEKKRDSVDCVEAFVLEHQTLLSQGKFVEAYDWEQIVNSYTNSINLNLPINVEEIVKKYCMPTSIYLLEEGIIEVLQELKRRGYSLAVITNGYLKYQLPVLDALGLTACFDKIITPDTAGYAKPDTRVFKELQAVVAHIGDRIDHDIIPANKTGVRTVWINRSLPNHFKQVKSNARAGSEGMEDILLAKLAKESNNNVISIPSEAIPTHVIFSITELLDILT